MSQDLIEPIRLRYDGGDAGQHRIDAAMLGQSLAGTGRVYRSIGHLHFNHQIRHAGHTSLVCQVGPPEKGSIFYLVYLGMLHGSMAMYPQLLFEMAELALTTFLGAMIDIRRGRRADAERSVAAIMEVHRNYHELAMRGLGAIEDQHRRTDEREVRVMDFVERLAKVNRTPMAEMVAPVGRGVRQLEHIATTGEQVVIDEPTAEVLRAHDDLTIGDEQLIRGVLLAVDTKTGAFRIEEEGTGAEYRGKITDPQLQVPRNVYTHALDEKLPISVRAKPTLDVEGQVRNLYVSDASQN